MVETTKFYPSKVKLSQFAKDIFSHTEPSEP